MLTDFFLFKLSYLFYQFDSRKECFIYNKIVSFEIVWLFMCRLELA